MHVVHTRPRKIQSHNSIRLLPNDNPFDVLVSWLPFFVLLTPALLDRQPRDPPRPAHLLPSPWPIIIKATMTGNRKRSRGRCCWWTWCTTATLLLLAAQQKHAVLASFEKIHTYTPLTDVTDHAAISFDLTPIERLVAGQTEEAFELAERVYNEGGNSKSVARLTLSLVAGAPVAFAAGTKLTGVALDGRSLVGELAQDVATGDSIVLFKYPTTFSRTNHLDCRIGGLPKEQHMPEGCKCYYSLFSMFCVSL